MKYFKLMQGNEFIGAISSDDFIAYIEGCGYMHTNETYGEYVEYNNQYYRTTWMKAPHTLYPYNEVSILPITRDEYLAFMRALQNNEVVIGDIDEPEPIPEPTPAQLADVEYVRNAKIVEMSSACRQTIEAGFDLEIHGATHHFSLTTQDQLNLMNLSTMAQTQQLIPYHADGEVCEFYTADEINEIIAQATAFKNYQLVYYNALKNYINALETITDISEVTYGIIIPEEYKTDVLKVLEY